MFRSFYHLFCTVISLSLLVVIYLTNKGIEIESLTGFHIPVVDVPACGSYVFYFVVSIFLTWVSSLLFGKFEKHALLNNNIRCIESADGTFIPTYFAYVFIGLSVTEFVPLLFCYGILAAICFIAQTYLFNPIFYLLGYRFYFITNSRNQKLLVMTKRKLLLSENTSFDSLYRLNDYTYVEL